MFRNSIVSLFFLFRLFLAFALLFLLFQFAAIGHLKRFLFGLKRFLFGLLNLGAFLLAVKEKGFQNLVKELQKVHSRGRNDNTHQKGSGVIVKRVHIEPCQGDRDVEIDRDHDFVEECHPVF
jgi:hypothetical protein